MKIGVPPEFPGDGPDIIGARLSDSKTAGLPTFTLRDKTYRFKHHERFTGLYTAGGLEPIAVGPKDADELTMKYIAATYLRAMAEGEHLGRGRAQQEIKNVLGL